MKLNNIGVSLSIDYGYSDNDLWQFSIGDNFDTPLVVIVGSDTFWIKTDSL